MAFTNTWGGISVAIQSSIQSSKIVSKLSGPGFEGVPTNRHGSIAFEIEII